LGVAVAAELFSLWSFVVIVFCSLGSEALDLTVWSLLGDCDPCCKIAFVLEVVVCVARGHTRLLGEIG